MRIIRYAILLAIVWTGLVAAFYLAVAIYGFVGLVAAVIVGAAWVGHTLESSVCRDDLDLALMRSGISNKEAAITQGIPAQQWSNQMAGDEMVSLWRLANLPATFWVEFAKLRLERFSAGVVIQSQELIGLIESVKSLTAQAAPQPVAVLRDRSEAA